MCIWEREREREREGGLFWIIEWMIQSLGTQRKSKEKHKETHLAQETKNCFLLHREESLEV